ncbi:MAG: transposase, partial [Gammaproteobacteria bacterium]|nr:transposase [Gammaproteobacteria bacterium]
MDNVFIERFWRSLKQEKIYRVDLTSVREAKDAISQYIEFYNNHRLHQSLGYKTPRFVDFADLKKKIDVIKMPMDMMDKSYDLPTYPQ